MPTSRTRGAFSGRSPPRLSSTPSAAPGGSLVATAGGHLGYVERGTARLPSPSPPSPPPPPLPTPPILLGVQGRGRRPPASTPPTAPSPRVALPGTRPPAP